MRVRRALLGVALLPVLAASAANAAHDCFSDGRRYGIVDPTDGDEIASLRVRGGDVILAFADGTSCATAQLSVKHRKNGRTRVRAKWRKADCPDAFRSPVKLRGTMAALGCADFRGRLRVGNTAAGIEKLSFRGVSTPAPPTSSTSTTTTTTPRTSTTVVCPGGIVGNLDDPPAIEILDAQAARGSGRATNIDARRVRVSGWAHADRYYPQPFLAAPFATVCSDGSWSFFSHPWNRMIVLLVDETYDIPAGPPPKPPSIDYHPATDPGVLAWAELPPSPVVRFGDAEWWLKGSNGVPTPPGPCVFAPENITVNGAGQLRLAIAKRHETWTCAEAVLDASRGFGTYTFQIASRLDRFAPQVVCAAFLFESLSREIDVECSPALTGLPDGCQYVVQPFTTPGNRSIWPMPPVAESTHRILWDEDRIEFVSWKGWGAFPPDPEDIVQQWTYSGPDIPPPGRERVRLSCWLFDGRPPQSDAGAVMVVHSFTHAPLSP